MKKKPGNVAKGRGHPTSLSVKEEFRAHYLYSGVASESARHVGIPERTGREFASELTGDPEFAAARRTLRAQALEEAVAMRRRVAEKALERFEGEAPMGEGAIDRRPDFGKLVLEAEKNAHNLAKIDNPLDPDKSGKTEVHIHMTPEPVGAAT